MRGKICDCEQCVLCQRFKAKSAKQLMGGLPSERVSVARPFSRVSVDFGGSVMTKQSKLRASRKHCMQKCV